MSHSVFSSPKKHSRKNFGSINNHRKITINNQLYKIRNKYAFEYEYINNHKCLKISYYNQEPFPILINPSTTEDKR
jgi:hypothetical protein